MYKILFDIDSSRVSSTDWLKNKLVLELSEQHFHYVVTDSKDELVKLKYYRLDATNQHELTETLEQIMNHEPCFKESLKDVVVIYHFPENILVPEIYFSSVHNEPMMELVNGDLKKGTILSERIQGQEIYNVFRVPTSIHKLLQQKFTNGKYWHYYSLHAEAIHKAHDTLKDSLWVSFYTHHMIVVAFAEQQLQLIQSFEYQHAEDAAYYLLSVCTQYGLSPLEIPLHVEGMIDRDSAMFRELEKYFQTIETMELNSIAETDGALRDFPSHFFSPLLKLLPCVS